MLTSEINIAYLQFFSGCFSAATLYIGLHFKQRSCLLVIFIVFD
jgi:hypothetical protein